MSKRMYAKFSDEAYNAFMKGEVVDNNGLRTLKGCFYHDQPTYEYIDGRKERLKDAVIILAVEAGKGIVHQVIIPEVQRFVHKKVYPCFAEQWDNWQDRRKIRKKGNQIIQEPMEDWEENDNVVSEKIFHNVIPFKANYKIG